MLIGILERLGVLVLVLMGRVGYGCDLFFLLFAWAASMKAFLVYTLYMYSCNCEKLIPDATCLLPSNQKQIWYHMQRIS